MSHGNIYYRRHLPHWQPPGAMYHVTFRLKGSLPAKVVANLRDERENLNRESTVTKDKTKLTPKEADARRRYFERLESLLEGHPFGPSLLRKPEIASIVDEALHYYDGKKYDLLAHCIMPNHVHAVFVCRVSRPDSSDDFLETSEDFVTDNAEQGVDRTGVPSHVVSDLLGSIKKYTSRRANRLLGRSGPFWQDESYDHVIRNIDELERTIRYVLNNPVKARLVESWHEWQWTYVKPGLFDMDQTL